MDIAKQTKDESVNSFKGANSAESAGKVTLQPKLHPSFKVYILAHLLRDLVKKHLKKPWRKLDRIRRFGYSYYNEYASDQFLSSPSIKHSKEAMHLTKNYIQTSPLHFDYSSRQIERSSYAIEHSPFQRVKKGSSKASFNPYDNHLTSSKYSVHSPNSDLYQSRKRGAGGGAYMSSVNGTSPYLFGSIHSNTQLDGHLDNQTTCKNLISSPSQKQEQGQRIKKQKAIKSFSKILFFTLKRALKTHLSSSFEKLRRNQDSSSNQNDPSSQLNRIEHLKSIRQQLLEEIEDLQDELLIKREEIQIEEKKMASLKSKSISYEEDTQSKRDKLQDISVNDSTKQFKLYYNSDEEDPSPSKGRRKQFKSQKYKKHKTTMEDSIDNEILDTHFQNPSQPNQLQ